MIYLILKVCYNFNQVLIAYFILNVSELTGSAAYWLTQFLFLKTTLFHASTIDLAH